MKIGHSTLVRYLRQMSTYWEEDKWQQMQQLHIGIVKF